MTCELLKKLSLPNLQIIDTRLPDFFEIGFLKSSLNISLKFSELEEIGLFIDNEKETIIICTEGSENESIQHLNRLGVKNIQGVLNFNDEMRSSKLFDMIISISTEELVLDSLHNQKAIIIDSRTKENFKSGKIHNAINIPINEIVSAATKLIKNQETLIYSNKGVTSMLACSYLKTIGFTNVKNVWGGFEQIKNEPKALID
jgi:rhodanese-related sulfurtransferase